MDEVTTAVTNRNFLSKLDSDDPAMIKKAAEGVNEFTRLKMREDGFQRRILPYQPITDSELDRAVDTDKPVKIVDMEPDSPAAQMIPYANLPNTRYIRGRRYRVMFARIVTPKFTKDVDELRTYHIDLRQVISDNSIKDMLAEEDGKFIYAVGTILGAAGSVVSETGVTQYHKTTEEITRESLADARKTLPRTPSHFETKTILINNVSIKDVEKWRRDEVGGDLAQDIVVNGFGERTFNGVTWIITIKRGLVPDSTIYQFSEPKNTGKAFMLEDATLHLKKEAYIVEWFAYENIGGMIGNVASVARHDFDAATSA